MNIAEINLNYKYNKKPHQARHAGYLLSRSAMVIVSLGGAFLFGGSNESYQRTESVTEEVGLVLLDEIKGGEPMPIIREMKTKTMLRRDKLNRWFSEKLADDLLRRAPGSQSVRELCAKLRKEFKTAVESMSVEDVENLYYDNVLDLKEV